MRAALGLLLATSAIAQSEFAVPRIGMMLAADGSLRPVDGIAGSFLVGGVVAEGVLSAACLGERCIAKTASAMVSASGKTDAPAGPAVIAIDGNAAWLHFPATREFARWEDGPIEYFGWRIHGEVLSMRAGPSGLEIAVRRTNGDWIVRADGAVVDSLIGAVGSALLLPDAAVFAAEEGVVIERLGRDRVRLALTNVTSIMAMGDRWVQISAAGAEYALRVEAGREALFLLPRAPEGGP